MSKIVKCDRCGKDITGKTRGYFAFYHKDDDSDDCIGKNPYESMDFCESCVTDIRICIERVIKL